MTLIRNCDFQISSGKYTLVCAHCQIYVNLRKHVWLKTTFVTIYQLELFIYDIPLAQEKLQMLENWIKAYKMLKKLSTSGNICGG